MKILVFTILWTMLCGGICSGEQLRTFTSQDGKEIKAKILTINPRTKKITLMRENGIKATVPANIFSKQDQDYIKEWLSAEQFHIKSKFQIKTDLDKKKTDKNTQTFQYSIDLRNRTNISIENIKVDYCIFVRVAGFNGTADSQKQYTGSLDFGNMEIGSSLARQTTKETLKTIQMPYTYEETESNGYMTYTYNKTGYKKSSEDKLSGIWLKVYGPVVGEKQVVRDFCYPNDLDKKYRWPRN